MIGEKAVKAFAIKLAKSTREVSNHFVKEDELVVKRTLVVIAMILENMANSED